MIVNNGITNKSKPFFQNLGEADMSVRVVEEVGITSIVLILSLFLKI